MIIGDYVTFETAKLLKEKGFDEFTTMVYNQNGDFMPNGTIVDAYQTFYSAPILQTAMKWLRETYKLHIITLPYAPINRSAYHPGEADMVYIAQLYRGIVPIVGIGRSVVKLTHEQACEAAIKYCLENLI